MNKKIDDWRSIFAPIIRFMHGGTIDRGNSDWVMLHHEQSTTLRRAAVTPTGRLSMEEHTFRLHSKTTVHSMQWG